MLHFPVYFGPRTQYTRNIYIDTYSLNFSVLIHSVELCLDFEGHAYKYTRMCMYTVVSPALNIHIQYMYNVRLYCT